MSKLLTCILSVALLWVGMCVFASAGDNTSNGMQSVQTAQLAPNKLLVPPKKTQPREPPGLWTKLISYVRYQQVKFYRQLAGAIKKVKSANSLTAAWTLVFLSFLYGVFHAAGPGHGKAVISAYLLANESLVRRGVALAFLSSVVQALTAIVLVTAVVMVLSATGQAARAMVGHLESASYALICAIGLYMLWAALRGHSHAGEPAPALVGTGGLQHTEPHVHDASCGHGAQCSHVHIPAPSKLQGDWSWRRAGSIAFAVGIRPCSGAVLVLLFAKTLGIYAAGIGATFAMALGTAITVSLIAILTLLSKKFAANLLSSRAIWLDWTFRALAVIGALAIFAIGLVLLVGSLGSSPPLV